MKIFNTRDHYGLLAMSLHWLMAVLIIGLSFQGVYMVRMAISLKKLRWFGYHKEFGMLVLMLFVLRFLWRMANTLPRLPEHTPLWQQTSAHMMHRLLYFFMLTVPLTGWFVTSTAGLPVSFFGWFVFPDMFAANKQSMKLFISMHKWLGYTLIMAFIIHSAAALKHHFYDRDDVLRRMLP